MEGCGDGGAGAGPTIIAFCQGEFDGEVLPDAPAVETRELADIGKKMQETLRSKGISSRYFVSSPCAGWGGGG